MLHKPPLASNPLKRKDSDHENEQSSSSNGDDEQPIPTPPSKHPKHSSSSSGNGGSSIDGDDNSNLFQEMNHINNELISLDDHFSIRADNKYFVEHHEMVDEFVENVRHFLSVMNYQRKRVAFERLSAVSLSYILKFVTMRDLIRNCQWVSKMWRQLVLEQDLRFELGSKISSSDSQEDYYSRNSRKQSKFNPIFTDSLLKSEFVGSVGSLRLVNVSAELLELLELNFKSLSKLQHLELEGYTLFGINKGVKFLKRFPSCKTLTSLNLSKAQDLREQEAMDLLSSELFANCKMLTFDINSHLNLRDFAGISQLSQLTHLELIKDGRKDDGLEEFLQSKVNLQYLNVKRYDCLISASNLFTINSTSNLNSNTVIFNHLTKLDISYCNVTNQTLFYIILSPKLPNLETLIAPYTNQSDQVDTSIAFTTSSSIGGYRNSSNLTELNLNNSYVQPVAEMIKFTPKLKRLLIRGLATKDDSKYVKDYSFLVHTDSKLSQLEYLEISRATGWIELIFTNSMFSNLKYLNCTEQWKKIGEDDLDREVKLIEECVNLPNLKHVSKKMTKNDNITKEQEVKVLQAFRNNPIFNSNQLKIEDFTYESVYPIFEKNSDRIHIRS